LVQNDNSPLVERAAGRPCGVEKTVGKTWLIVADQLSAATPSKAKLTDRKSGWLAGESALTYLLQIALRPKG